MSTEKIIREFKGQSLLDFPTDYVVVDIETTGTSSKYNEIIEVACIKYENNCEVDTFRSFVHINSKLTSFISELTGITDEDLVDAPPIENVIEDFINFVSDDIIVGHSVNFDINFLYDRCLELFGVMLCNDYVDTLRIARNNIADISNYKLATLAAHFDIDVPIAHRALNDCYTTNACLNKLKETSAENQAKHDSIMEQIHLDTSKYDVKDKYFIIHGTLRSMDPHTAIRIINEAGGRYRGCFYKKTNFAILGTNMYDMFISNIHSEFLDKAHDLKENGNLSVISEAEFCHMCGYDYKCKPSSKKTPYYMFKKGIKAKDIISNNTEFDTTHPLYKRVCVFTGTLDQMPRKDAMQMVADYGGICGDSVTKSTNYLILGNNDYCYSIKDGKSYKQKKAESLKLKGQDIEIISEDVFYDMLEEDLSCEGN